MGCCSNWGCRSASACSSSSAWASWSTSTGSRAGPCSSRRRQRLSRLLGLALGAHCGVSPAMGRWFWPGQRPGSFSRCLRASSAPIMKAQNRPSRPTRPPWAPWPPTMRRRRCLPAVGAEWSGALHQHLQGAPGEPGGALLAVGPLRPDL